MAYLTIAGVTYKVGAEGAAELEPLEIGQEEPSFSGALISTISGEKRRFGFSLVEMTEAEFQTLRDAVAAGAHVTVGGDMIDGGPLTCRVKIGSAAFVRTSASTHVRGAAITVLEV